MQIGEPFSSPAVSGATTINAMTDPMSLAARVAARAEALTLPSRGESKSGRPVAGSDTMRRPLPASTFERDILSGRPGRHDDDPIATDAANQMAAMGVLWQPPRLSNAHEDDAPLGSVSCANEAAGAAVESAAAMVKAEATADDADGRRLSLQVADAWVSQAGRSAAVRRRGVAARSASVTLQAAASSDPAAMSMPTPTPTPTPTTPTTPHAMRTAHLAVMRERQLAVSPPLVFPTAAIDPDGMARAGTAAIAVSVASPAMVHASSDMARSAHVATGRDIAAAHAASLIDEAEARQALDSGTEQTMPVASANDLLHRSPHTALAADAAHVPAAAVESLPRPNTPSTHLLAEHGQASQATLSPQDGHVTRLSVPFNSWPTQSRVELSLNVNELGLPAIRMLPSTDGVRHALEQAWSTASADWALDTPDDGTPDRRHSRSSEREDDEEENAS